MYRRGLEEPVSVNGIQGIGSQVQAAPSKIYVTTGVSRVPRRFPVVELQWRTSRRVPIMLRAEVFISLILLARAYPLKRRRHGQVRVRIKQPRRRANRVPGSYRLRRSEIRGDTSRAVSVSAPGGSRSFRSPRGQSAPVQCCWVQARTRG